MFTRTLKNRFKISISFLAKFLINNAEFAGRRLRVWKSLSQCRPVLSDGARRGGGETSGIPTLTNNYHNILRSVDIKFMSIFIQFFNKKYCIGFGFSFSNIRQSVGSIEQIN